MHMDNSHTSVLTFSYSLPTQLSTSDLLFTKKDISSRLREIFAFNGLLAQVKIRQLQSFRKANKEDMLDKSFNSAYQSQNKGIDYKV